MLFLILTFCFKIKPVQIHVKRHWGISVMNRISKVLFSFRIRTAI